jgi:5'(3')-deoxyribonucleotidase
MRIGIDFDDVVADSGAAIIEMHNKKRGTHFKRSDFKTYFFEETWGMTREERRKEIDEFFATDQWKKISPMAGSLKVIEALKTKGHELYIITGRNDKDIAQTELWIEKNFPSVFQGVHFANSRKKSEICKELGIEIMIDDNPDVALECATEGIKVFIFDQSWNREREFPINVERVSSWQDIIRKL